MAASDAAVTKLLGRDQAAPEGLLHVEEILSVAALDLGEGLADRVVMEELQRAGAGNEETPLAPSRHCRDEMVGRGELDGANLYTMQRNRYYRRGDALATDLGPVAAFLQCASRAEPQILGKPSPMLFDAIAHQAGCERSQLVMAGDDAEFDASESVKLGMAGVLVRTGKYRDGDEAHVDPVPTATLASVGEIPGWIGL